MSYCSIENCGAKHHSHGFCRKHAWHFKQNGDPKIQRYERHGKDKKTYNVWYQMVDRCTNPKNRAYVNYGAKGVKVCDKWMRFEDFYEDMGQQPVGLTLERKNNALGYCPDNVIWASRATQQRNTSRTKLSIDIARDIRQKRDEGMKMQDIADLHNISAAYVSQIVSLKIWKEQNAIKR